MFGKKKSLEDYKLYDITNSQNGMYLMYKFGLHKQMVQIPTSVAVDYELDFDLLQKALDIEIQRNDSLRNRFTKQKGKVKQYFLKDCSYKAVLKEFANAEEQSAFFGEDAMKPVNFLKDEVYRIYFLKLLTVTAVYTQCSLTL
jgi:hypothetical protein